MPLKQTSLYQKHTALNARMVPFGGWEMPLQYEGILAEYEETRRKASVFDTSHMGEFIVEGEAVASGLDKIVTQPIHDMPVKSCRYGVMLNKDGGMMDDLIVYRLAKKKWMIVVNGATTQKDARHFREHMTGQGTFIDNSGKIGKLDIQGPLSREILSSFIEDMDKLDYYTFDEFEVLGEKAIVSRTGYTGELGYEIYFPWDKTGELWDELLKKDVRPAGLGARDILRIEVCYNLYGHELTENISPLEAGLSRFIDWEKAFVGKEALRQKRQAGLGRKWVCFISETRRSPREHHKIYSQQGDTEIGIVTSGTFSPGLKRGIGIGFVAGDYGARGDKIFFGDEKNKLTAQIAARPIYKDGSLKR